MRDEVGNYVTGRRINKLRSGQRGALAQIRLSRPLISAELFAYLQNGPRRRRLTSKEVVYAN